MYTTVPIEMSIAVLQTTGTACYKNDSKVHTQYLENGDGLTKLYYAQEVAIFSILGLKTTDRSKFWLSFCLQGTRPII